MISWSFKKMLARILEDVMLLDGIGDNEGRPLFNVHAIFMVAHMLCSTVCSRSVLMWHQGYMELWIRRALLYK
ncbi:unnamed protein product [Linum tenue]|uniref:Uncharacterized protein n=1 Tax=Linum tenue TaxID=586396 RepID=A0AAV0JJC6_9ROSI|nr:unnamed protein product [Linum tenue]